MRVITGQSVARFLGLSVAWWGLSSVAIAQLPQSIEFLPTPPDQGSPDGRQRGGATRGDCVAFQDLTAVVPRVEGVVWSQTTSALPQFFFEVPAELTTEIPLEFVVQDSNDEYAIRQQFTVNADTGLFALPILDTAAQPGLAVGETYGWTFSIYCDEARPSASVSVSGTVQRVADSVGGNVEGVTLTAEEQFGLLQQYAVEGIWHEAIELAIALHTAQPNNETYASALNALLEQAGITETSMMEEDETIEIK